MENSTGYGFCEQGSAGCRNLPGDPDIFESPKALRKATGPSWDPRRSRDGSGRTGDKCQTPRFSLERRTRTASASQRDRPVYGRAFSFMGGAGARVPGNRARPSGTAGRDDAVGQVQPLGTAGSGQSQPDPDRNHRRGDPLEEQEVVVGVGEQTAQGGAASAATRLRGNILSLRVAPSLESGARERSNSSTGPHRRAREGGRSCAAPSEGPESPIQCDSSGWASHSSIPPWATWTG